MDAAITNNGATAKFIPGPNFNLDAGETKTWSDIILTDLDSNNVIKAGVIAGILAVSMTPGPNDAALATQGAMGLDGLAVYAFAALPTGFNGRMVFVTDGRKGGEGAGAGTGLPAYYDATAAAWLNFHDNAATAA
jgi:hypothetical protein